MILTDTGPVVALLDSDDHSHTVCREAVRSLPSQRLVTTWPCFTEAMYLLGSIAGYRYQAALWTLRSSGRLALHDLNSDEIDQMDLLMNKYKDTPMDLADASLVAAADSLSMDSILTLDRDFFVYRLRNGKSLRAIPRL